MNEIDGSEVQECMYMLSIAETPSDAVSAWAILEKKHPNLSAIVAFKAYEKRILPAAIKKYTKKPNDYLVPYFSSENMYFLDDELLTEMFASKEFKFPIDYTLMFDSNVATYINTLIRGEPLGNIQSKLVTLIDDILYDDLNFDHLFYMAENVKNVFRQIEHNNISKLSFWKSLDKRFRNNMVSLQLFRSIDSKAYKKTLNPKPQFSYREAARHAIEFSYDFYASDTGKEHILNFVLIQKMILLQVIGMVKIQLSSKKSPKNKMGEYFEYVNTIVGAYFDRESIIAHQYFNNRKNVALLEKIKKGCSKTRLMKQLDNIAWDMAAPRFMEKLIVSAGEGRFFIPLFLTFDSNLKELLSFYPVKGVIFNKASGNFYPIPETNTKDYFKIHGCLSELEILYSPQVKTERLSRPKPSRLSIHKLIKHEYRLLRKLI